jgi:hypothetical protein
MFLSFQDPRLQRRLCRQIASGGAVMFGRIPRSLLLFAAVVPSAGAQALPWLEVTTPHFVVISHSTEKEARRAGIQFERMRSVFGRIFPDTNIDTATPIVVLAVQDTRNLQALEPPGYLGKVPAEHRRPVLAYA